MIVKNLMMLRVQLHTARNIRLQFQTVNSFSCKNVYA